jgi:hypothetical protein
MIRTAIQPSPRIFAVVLIAAAALLALGAMPRAASADGPPGVAVRGPEIEFTTSVVVPINVQVDPFGNATQTAQNTSSVSQSAQAQAGMATATNGGVAVSGPAIAGAISVITQINVQVNACPNTSTHIVQTALNSATLNQAAIARSGDATANGPGSFAMSGAARSIAVSTINQRNIQVYTCQ